jgi:hypothetical protein
MFKFLQDKRLKKEKTKHAVQKKRANYFVEKYMEEHKKRSDLEALILNEQEKEYVLSLLLQDEVINSHKHTSQGLYSELDTELLDFISNVRAKIRNM